MAAPLRSRGATALTAMAALVALALLASACGSSSSGAGAVVRSATTGGPAGAGAGAASEPSPTPPTSTPGPAAADPGTASGQPLTGDTGSAAPATYSGVLLAAGVRQWVHCAGAGPLTVVVVPGLGSSHEDWSSVTPSMEELARTCVYDRPGLGSSPPRSAPNQVVDAGLHARELHALLRAAGERGPYVVVGHSYGGLVARAFVHLYATEVRGVLLAESVTPGDVTSGTFWTEAGHRVDLLASGRADAGGPSMGRLPLLVLSASNPEGAHLGGPTFGRSQALVDRWRRQQAGDTRLSTNSVQVIARSGHLLQEDDPEAVLAATRALVAAAGGGTLACGTDWAAVDATCR